MERTLLKDYFLKNPNAPKLDGEYPLDMKSKRKAILCINDAGYNFPCIIGDLGDCRDCWNSMAKFDFDGSLIKLV